MTCPDRKSIDPIALLVGDGRVSALQKFINIAPWDHDDIQAEIQEVFAGELAPTATADSAGVVGVIDAQATIETNDHDFGSVGDGTVIPHGIYDVARNKGYIHQNTSHDTSELACDSIAAWWEDHGQPA